MGFDPFSELVELRCADDVARERSLRVRAQRALVECAATFKDELDSLRDRLEAAEGRCDRAYALGFRDGVEEMRGAWEQERRWEECRRAHPAFQGRGGVV